jgi:hypothetical protein
LEGFNGFHGDLMTWPNREEASEYTAGRAQAEARDFARLAHKGHSIDRLRADIGCNPQQIVGVLRMCANDGPATKRARHVAQYRALVLKYFDAMVENGMR